MAQNQIAQLISSQGPVSVERFMQMAVEAYYAQGTAFGRSGDFVTAPEISQVFGELIGGWCAVMWTGLGKPATFHLVELGPGRGTLMADLLRAAGHLPGFLQAARLHLVETSRRLRDRQGSALKNFEPSWHAHLDGVPDDAPLILVANEFLDALPIRQFVKQEDGWHERLVAGTPAGDLEFQTAMEPETAPPLAPHVLTAPTGSIAEACPQALKLVDRLGDRFNKNGGAALFIDYGPLESGPGDSLQAVKGHSFAKVLDEPGSTDLTAHVDFAALARRARKAKLKAWEAVPQGVWLQRLGILERTRQLAAQAKGKQRSLLVSGTRRLIDPQEMGTLFKVFALTPLACSIPPGFEVT